MPSSDTRSRSQCAQSPVSPASRQEIVKWTRLHAPQNTRRGALRYAVKGAPARGFDIRAVLAARSGCKQGFGTLFACCARALQAAQPRPRRPRLPKTSARGRLARNRDCTRTPTHDCLGCRDRRNAFCRRVCLAVRDQAGSASAHKRETPRRAKRAQTPPAHAAAAGCPSRPCSCARFGARPSRPGALNRRAATRRAWPLRSASWSQRASRLTAAARATLRASPARSLGIAPLCGRLQRIHDAP